MVISKKFILGVLMVSGVTKSILSLGDPDSTAARAMGTGRSPKDGLMAAADMPFGAEMIVTDPSDM
jgi:hypothetical protein